MKALTLSFMDNEAETTCTVSLAGGEEGRDFMEMKLEEMKPSERAIYMSMQAIKKLQGMYELQLDWESIFENDPGFCRPENESIYH